jgi:hypothetical protein
VDLKEPILQAGEGAAKGGDDVQVPVEKNGLLRKVFQGVAFVWGCLAFFPWGSHTSHMSFFGSPKGR